MKNFMLCVVGALIPTLFVGLHAQNTSKPNIVGPAGIEVNSYTGNMFYERGDLLIPGFGTDLEITFAYNSQKTALNHGYGNGWTFTYNLLYETQGSDIVIRRDDGRKDLFKWNGSAYDPPTGIFDILEEYQPNKFRLSFRSGLRFYFDDAGHKRLTAIEDPDGNWHSVNYSGGLPSSVTDASGRKVDFIFQGGLLKEVQDNNTSPMRKYVYSYDGANNLIKVTDPLGHFTQYVYDASRNLTQIQDALGNVIKMSYQANAVVSSVTTPHSYTTFTYSPGNTETVVTKHNAGASRSTTYSFDGLGRVIQQSGACCGYSVSYQYDNDNNITEMTDANGNTTTYTYDNIGNLLTTTDPLNNTASSTYQSGTNWKTSDTDKKGNITSYSYDARGNLLTIARPLSITESFTYDSKGNKTSYTDGKGQTTTYSYDLHGNRTGITYPQGSEIMTYDNVGNMLSSSIVAGATTSYSYDLLNQMTSTTDPKGHRTDFVYDANGNQISETDGNNNTTTYLFDGLNRSIKTTRADGAFIETIYNDYGEIVSTRDDEENNSSLVYDARGLVITQTDPLGDITTFTYDANGNTLTNTNDDFETITYTYDAMNRVIEVIDRLGGSTVYTYDANGNRISMRDPLDRTTTYCYDALDRQTCVTDALNNTTTTAYDNNDNKLSMTDARGNTFSCVFNAADRIISLNGPMEYQVTYDYDVYGRLISETDANGNATTYTYDAVGQIATITNAAGETTSYTYDAMGNQTTVALPNGNSLSATYDSNDETTSSSGSGSGATNFSYDSRGNVLTQTDANNNVTTFQYDETGRLVARIDPSGQTTTYEYGSSSKPIRITDRNGNVTRYTYDANERLKRIVDAEGNRLIFGYDAVGNVISRRDGAGNVTTYSYDALNRLTGEFFADATSISYSYDAVGNMLSRTDNKGNTTSYTYDDLNRLTLRDYPGSNDDSFSYDLGGRMLTAANSNTNISFSYDAANRKLSETLNGLTTTYSYNEALRTRTVSYPGGRVITYKENTDRQLVEIKEGGTTLVTFSYDAAQNLTGRSYPNNGTSTSYTYNANSLLLEVFHDPNKFVAFTYTYDPEGNFETERKNHHLQNSQKYFYDRTNQLKNYQEGTLNGGVINPILTQTAYNYGASGNRSVVDRDGVITEYYSNNMNEYTDIIQGAAVNPVYDANGNLTNDGVNTYTYDYENRLTAVNSGATATYDYDAFGRRVRKQSAAGTVYFLYDGINVIEERDGAGIVLATYVHGQGVDQVLCMDRAGDRYFYHENAIGSIAAITDKLGALVELYEYDPYGNVTIYDNAYNPRATSAVGNPYYFTGRRLDEETGLHYFRARYYDGKHGRFISRDPIGIWGDPANGGNGYSYVANDPVNNIDPDGSKKRKWWKKFKKKLKKTWKKTKRVAKRIFKIKKSNSKVSCCLGSWPAPRTLKIKFKDCNATRKNIVKVQLCRAFLGAGRAWAHVEHLYSGKRGTERERIETFRRVKEFFGGLDGETKYKYLRILERKMRKTFKGFNRTITIKCKSTGHLCHVKDNTAWTMWRLGAIKLCPKFWRPRGTGSPAAIAKATADYQASTLYHEMTHRYGRTYDGGRTFRDAYKYEDFVMKYYIP